MAGWSKRARIRTWCLVNMLVHSGDAFAGGRCEVKVSVQICRVVREGFMSMAWEVAEGALARAIVGVVLPEGEFVQREEELDG